MSNPPPDDPPSPSQPPSTSRPGWYPDPWAQTDLRYWDGARWTGHVTTPTSASEPPAKVSTARTVGIVFLALLAAVVGYFLLVLASYLFA